MSAKFSPGPWNYDKYEQLQDANGDQVNVWGLGIGFTSRDQRTEANAKLMAAAPELYESLNEFIADAYIENDICGWCGEIGKHGGACRVPKAEAALRKARGL